MFDKKSKNRLSDIQKETIMEEVIKESNKDGKITKNIETRNIETRNTETKNFNNEKDYEKLQGTYTWRIENEKIKYKNSEDYIIKRLRIVSIIYLILMMISLSLVVFMIGSSSSTKNDNKEYNCSIDSNKPDNVYKCSPITKKDKNNSNDNNSIFVTIITFLFGTASKALYKAMILESFRFDEDKLKKNQTMNKLKTYIDVVIDIFSGIAILIYLLKYANLENPQLSFAFLVLGILMALLMLYNNRYIGYIDK